MEGLDHCGESKARTHFSRSPRSLVVLASGFTSMRYDGLKKALRGLTILEEIDRVCPWG